MTGFTIDARDGMARATQLRTPHGVLTTPTFMPVGTLATVRALSPADLRAAGCTMLLANAYHLHLRPGEDVVSQLDGIHRFMAWDGPILTDSGGFQVFSLDGFREVHEEGVTFQSHIDGSRRVLTPERSVEIQWTLGADIAMAFDHVIPGGADLSASLDAWERTLRWLERSATRHRELAAEAPGRQALWPIVQGGTHTSLRIEAARQTQNLGDWGGIGIGGLSVGESKEAMYDVLEALEPHLPVDRPRYLMGVGFPVDIVEGVARGVDMFDCVAPTRMGRNGTAFTAGGPVNIKRAEYRQSTRPLEDDCDCETCRTYSRAYLRHLFVSDELLVLRLLSLHNVHFLMRLTAAMRESIHAGTFATWRAAWLQRYLRGDS